MESKIKDIIGILRETKSRDRKYPMKQLICICKKENIPMVTMLKYLSKEMIMDVLQ